MTIPEAKRTARIIEWRQLIYERQQSGQSVSAWCLCSVYCLSAERNKDFEIDDLLPWSEEMKSRFSAV